MITALGIVIYRKEEGFAVLSLKILVPYHAGDPGLIPGLEGSPEEGNDSPFQYSCLGNPMDRGAWRATAYGGVKESAMAATKQQQQHICLPCFSFFLLFQASFLYYFLLI